MQDTIIVTVLGIIGRSAGLIIPFVISACFGITKETDSFFFVLSILVFFSGVFAWAIEAVIVPFVVRLKDVDSKEIGEFAGNLLLILWFFSAIVILVLILLIKPALLTSKGASEYSVNFIQRLLMEFSPVILLVVTSAVISGIFNSHKLFWVPAISLTLSIIIMIVVTFLLKGRMGIHALVLGYNIGESCRLVVLLFFFRRHKIGKLVFSFQKLSIVGNFLKTSCYMIIGMCVAGLPPVINRIIASHFEQGSVSVIEYAEKMFYIPAGLLGSGFLTVILSYWSKHYVDSGAGKLWKDVLFIIKLMTIVLVAGGVILFLLRYRLTSIFIGWGKIPKEQLVQVGEIFGIYQLGLLPNVLNLILSRAHLALKNTAILMNAAIIGVVVLLLTNAIITSNIGLPGIALGVASSQTSILLYLFLTFKRTILVENKTSQQN